MSDVDMLINTYADQYGVPREEAHALAQYESGKNQKSVSSSGARGVMQLMPSSFPHVNINDLATNIKTGLQYYAEFRKRYGDAGAAYAAYNGGVGSAKQYLRTGTPFLDHGNNAVSGFLQTLGHSPMPTRNQTFRPLPAQNKAPQAQPYKSPFDDTEKQLVGDLVSGLHRPYVNYWTTPNADLTRQFAPETIPQQAAPQGNLTDLLSMYGQAPAAPLQQGGPVAPVNYAKTPLELAQRNLDTIDQAPTQYSQQELEAQRQAAGSGARLDYLNQNPVPKVNTPVLDSLPLPERQQLPIPQGVAPRTEPISTGLGLLAGFIDPRHAGQFNSAPIQASIEESHQQTADQLRNYQLGQRQADERFSDALLGRNDQQRVNEQNAQNQYNSGIVERADQLKRTEEKGGLVGDQAGAKVAVPGYQGLDAGARAGRHAEGSNQLLNTSVGELEKNQQNTNLMDNKRLDVLRHFEQVRATDAYHDAVSNETIRRDNMQSADKQRGQDIRATTSEDVANMRAKGTKTDPLMQTYRTLRNQQMKLNLNNSVSPQQKAELSAASADAQRTNSLYMQATGDYQKFDADVRAGRILSGNIEAQRQAKIANVQAQEQSHNAALQRLQDAMNHLPASTMTQVPSTPGASVKPGSTPAKKTYPTVSPDDVFKAMFHR